MDKESIRKRLTETGRLLVNDYHPEGYWKGKLSSSALSTAVAIAALHFSDTRKYAGEYSMGVTWLEANINPDGSYGDTPGSPGNISTSLLVFAALNLHGDKDEKAAILQGRIAAYLEERGINIASPDIAKTVLDHYQKDFTFSVPILVMCGLCGVPGPKAFDHIPVLPFELLLLPGNLYRLLNLTVVSYALPALASVGLLIAVKRPSGKMRKAIVRLSTPSVLKKLHQMLPESGGYLEAIPLTAFVTMSLICAGHPDSEIVKKGIGFLLRMQREDGSWPIDIDLSTWVTSLTVKAFRSNLDIFLKNGEKQAIKKHLIAIQTKTTHPFNQSPSGGWGWTNHPGSVPDGDDTPGAILALLALADAIEVKNEVLAGGRWLLQLQNNNGGFPTFSRGWGKLPFDQSCSDLTGHCLLALSSIIGHYGLELGSGDLRRFRTSFRRAFEYLQRNQHPDGSFLPLWFGNQMTRGHASPVYGTARVLTYLRDTVSQSWLPEKLVLQIETIIKKGEGYLLSAQNSDGSWGGDKSIAGTIEETALAVSALVSEGNLEYCCRGLEWIETAILYEGFKPSPIGLYFASLWYDEKLYPAIFCLEALSRMDECRIT